MSREPYDWLTVRSPRLTAQIRDCLSADGGGLLENYLIWATQKSQAPAQFHLASLLPSIAHALTTAGVKMDKGYEVDYPRIAVGLVGGSGCGKTTALKLAKRITTKAMQQAYGPTVTDPYLRTDGSPEGVFTAMKTWYDERIGVTPVILYHDEFTTLLRKETFADAFCTIADGEDWRRHLRGSQKMIAEGKMEAGDEDVVRPIVQATFCSTPINMSMTASSEQVGGGAFARMLWFRGELDSNSAMYYVPSFVAQEAEFVNLFARWIEAWNTAAQKSNRTLTLAISPECDEYIKDNIWRPLLALSKGSRAGGILNRYGMPYAKQLAMIFAASRLSPVASVADGIAAGHVIRLAIESVLELDAIIATSKESICRSEIVSFLMGVAGQNATTTAIGRALRRWDSGVRRNVLKTLLEDGVVDQVIDASKPGRAVTRYSLTDIGRAEYNSTLEEASDYTQQLKTWATATVPGEGSERGQN